MQTICPTRLYLTWVLKASTCSFCNYKKKRELQPFSPYPWLGAHLAPHRNSTGGAVATWWPPLALHEAKGLQEPTWGGQDSSSLDAAAQVCFLHHNQARQLGTAAKGAHTALPALRLPLGFWGLQFVAGVAGGRHDWGGLSQILLLLWQPGS